MALIECPECKGQVSDKAEACPHCGAPVEAEFEAPMVVKEEEEAKHDTKQPPPPGTYLRYTPKKSEIKLEKVCRNCGYVGLDEEFLLMQRKKRSEAISSCLGVILVFWFVYEFLDFSIFLYAAFFLIFFFVIFIYQNFSNKFKKCPNCSEKHPLSAKSPEGQEMINKFGNST